MKSRAPPSASTKRLGVFTASRDFFFHGTSGGPRGRLCQGSPRINRMPPGRQGDNLSKLRWWFVEHLDVLEHVLKVLLKLDLYVVAVVVQVRSAGSVHFDRQIEADAKGWRNDFRPALGKAFPMTASKRFVRIVDIEELKPGIELSCLGKVPRERYGGPHDAALESSVLEARIETHAELQRALFQIAAEVKRRAKPLPRVCASRNQSVGGQDGGPLI